MYHWLRDYRVRVLHFHSFRSITMSIHEIGLRLRWKERRGHGNEAEGEISALGNLILGSST